MSILNRVFNTVAKGNKGREPSPMHKMGTRYQTRRGSVFTPVSENERKQVEQKNKDAEAYERAYDAHLKAKDSIRNTSGKEREEAEKRIEETRKALDKARGDFKTRWTSNR